MLENNTCSENQCPDSSLSRYDNNGDTTTYIYVTQQIIEAAVAVVRGTAEGLEDAEPLGTQGAAIRCQLCAQDPDIVHPNRMIRDMKLQPDRAKNCSKQSQTHTTK